LQWAKKIVPDPFLPTSSGSSPKCGPVLATCAKKPVLQNPFSEVVRSTLQVRGHTVQHFSSAAAFFTRSASSPVA